jgi:hypothetical protein
MSDTSDMSDLIDTSERKARTTPEISWDFGTAYDLFASLHVLHEPGGVGLRASWAAGVRSRLPAEHRDFLEETHELFWNPLVWIYKLPAPKDAATALWSMSQIPPAERLPALALEPEVPSEISNILCGVAARGEWTDLDRETLRAAFSKKDKQAHSKTIEQAFAWWARPAEFGERYLAALQSYHMVFFAEEERRIRPALEEAVERGKKQARQLDFHSLVEELSRGVQVESLLNYEQVVFAPSYWMSPLVTWSEINSKKMMLLYGGRPADEALVPGETVPEAMLRGLRALDDRYAEGAALPDQATLTPSKLAKRLPCEPDGDPPERAAPGGAGT